MQVQMHEFKLSPQARLVLLSWIIGTWVTGIVYFGQVSWIDALFAMEDPNHRLAYFCGFVGLGFVFGFVVGAVKALCE